MAEENKEKKSSNTKQEEKKSSNTKPEEKKVEKQKPNKSIDVTKPKKETPPKQSSIDASRVSAYTLREQQALERLKKKVGTVDHKESKASNIKTIVAIILIVVLIILAVVFVILISRTKTTPEENYDMRLSMQIENKSSLSIITESGVEQLREIHPGSKIPLRATVMNSNDIRGDITQEGDAPPAIYVRFKLVLILDYEERYDVMIPTMSNRWYKYNKEVEDYIAGGVTFDDHYYYYKGALSYIQSEELFSEIEFSGDVLTCEDGGKYGQIQVKVESIEANINYILGHTLWPSAPQGWIAYMLSNYS